MHQAAFLNLGKRSSSKEINNEVVKAREEWARNNKVYYSMTSERNILC
jgi:hypothetical protein